MKVDVEAHVRVRVHPQAAERGDLEYQVAVEIERPGAFRCVLETTWCGTLDAAVGAADTSLLSRRAKLAVADAALRHLRLGGR